MDWDCYIDGIVLVYNIMLYEIMGILLYRMLFVREVNLLLNLMIEKDIIDSDCEISDVKYVYNLENNFREIYY